MNPFFSFLSAAYIFAIFYLANSKAVSRIAEFNPYSLLHIPLYGILTLLILLALCAGKGRYTGKRMIAAGLLVGLVGFMDEIYQTFIPGRTGSIGDFLLDLLGMAIALQVFRRVFPVLPAKSGLWAKKE